MAKVNMPDDYGERAALARKHKKDGWCVFCEQPVTVPEYKGSHWAGKCLSVNPSPLGDDDSEVTKADAKAKLTAEVARYEKLAETVSDQALARSYYDKARQLRKAEGKG